MGVKGNRPIRHSNVQFDEPQLIVKVEDIIKAAKDLNAIDANDNINIFKVAESYNIEISFEEMESSNSGYLRFINNKWIIGVNKLHNTKRQRFTVAHELGHFLMHKEKNLEFEDSIFFRNNNFTAIEFAANEFAAKLLMPENRIRELIELGEKKIDKLANIFDVSLAAMKYRVLSLGFKIKDNG